MFFSFSKIIILYSCRFFSFTYFSVNRVRNCVWEINSNVEILFYSYFWRAHQLAALINHMQPDIWDTYNIRGTKILQPCRVVTWNVYQHTENTVIRQCDLFQFTCDQINQCYVFISLSHVEIVGSQVLNRKKPHLNLHSTLHL